MVPLPQSIHCGERRMWQVYFDFGKLSYERLRAGGANITFESYEGLAHNIYPEEMQSIMTFWQQCLPPE